MRAAVEAGDGQAALEAALALWRESRAPALADLVDAISLRVSAPAIVDDEVWSKLASGRSAIALGPLLAGIPSLPVSFLPSAAELLATFPDDPRLAMAIAGWAIDPITTSSSTYPFWTRSLDAVARIADTRVLPHLGKRLRMKPENSQFWERFYTSLKKTVSRIEAARASKPDPKLDARQLAKLGKPIAGLGVVDAFAAAPKRVTARTTPAVDGPPLAQALAHLGSGHVQDAIDALLVFWRAQRVPAVADLIDRATRLLPTWDVPLAGRNDKEVHEAWLAAFASDPMAAMPQLLATVDDGGAARAERHLIELAGLPDDPRIAARLTEVAGFYGISPERTQYWRSLFELLARTADVRTAAPLRAQFGDFANTYFNHYRQGRRIVGDFVMSPPTPPQLGPGDTTTIAKIAKALETLEQRRDSTEDDLLRAIAEAWDDDGPRLVYADWLMEREHPRGELIALACKGPLADADRKRLAYVGWTSSFGGISEVADHDELVRGLPATITLGYSSHVSPMVWRHVPHYPLLAAIEAVSIDANAVLPIVDDLANVLLAPRALRLAKVTAPPDYLASLAPLVADHFRIKGKALVRA